MASFGILMGIIFPFYAAIFVTFKEGMLWYFVAGALLAGVTVGVVNQLMVKKILLKEIRKIDTLAKSIAAGDLSCSIEIDSNDEIGFIVGNLNQSISGMRSLMDHIADISKGVGQTVRELDDFRTELHSLFEGTQQQTEAITRSVKEVEQSGTSIRSAVQSLVNHSESIRNSADVMDSTIVSALHQSKNDSELTTRAQTEFRYLQTLSQTLKESSANVTHIVKSIEDIAKSSSLLSVNASVEAAVAGVAGKGFQVVANEVHSLSQQSLKAANEIEDIAVVIENGATSFIEKTQSSYDDLTVLANHSSLLSNQLEDESVLVSTVSHSIGEVSQSADLIAEESEQNYTNLLSLDKNFNSFTIQLNSVRDRYTNMEQTITQLSTLAEDLDKYLKN